LQVFWWGLFFGVCLGLWHFRKKEVRMTEAQMVNRIKELEKDCWKMRDLIDVLYKENEKLRKKLEELDKPQS
jgi:predicted nuclease with TOPRIM domain